jgi:hypothetical protein
LFHHNSQNRKTEKDLALFNDKLLKKLTPVFSPWFSIFDYNHMLYGKQILKRVSSLLLVFIHISFTYFFQINYQSSVLRYGLQCKQSVATQSGEKEGQATVLATATDIVSRSKIVPAKRFFQDETILIQAPAGISGTVFIPYQFDRYNSPPVNKLSAHTCPERGPPVVA